MPNVILGAFQVKSDAENVISDLEATGFRLEDLFIIMRDKSEIDQVSNKTGAEKVIGSTIGGATTGVVLGGLAGLVASFIVPGLGTFLIGGPTAVALGLTGAAAATVSGAATGALTGGVLGALVSIFGLSEDDARLYEQRLNEGAILLAVPSQKGKEKKLKGLLKRHNGENIRVVKLPEKEARKQPMYAGQAAVHFSQIKRRRPFLPGRGGGN